MLTMIMEALRGLLDKQVAKALSRAGGATAPQVRATPAPPPADLFTPEPVRLTTAAQLDALPVSTAVITGHSVIFQNWGAGMWHTVGDRRAYTAQQVLVGVETPGSGWARVLH